MKDECDFLVVNLILIKRFGQDLLQIDRVQSFLFFRRELVEQTPTIVIIEVLFNQLRETGFDRIFCFLLIIAVRFPDISCTSSPSSSLRGAITPAACPKVDQASVWPTPPSLCLKRRKRSRQCSG